LRGIPADRDHDHDDAYMVPNTVPRRDYEQSEVRKGFQQTAFHRTMRG
jgi:hypothetical protein